MRKLLLLFVVVLMSFPVMVMAQCGTNLTATDQDGAIYQSLKVGPHCWMQTNLKTNVPGSRIYSSDMYPDTNANLETFGRLYLWSVAAGDPMVVGEHNFVKGVCPEGWHLPLPVELQQLAANEVSAVRSTEQWLIPGTNTTGFDLLPGGFYNGNINRCENLLGEAYFWSVGSNKEPVEVWADCHCEMFLLNPGKINNALSVRCVYKIYQAQVTTEAATDIKAYQANLNGNVVFAGYDQNFTRGFVYGTDMNNLIFDTAQLHQSAEGQYFFKIENLEPNTTYYYKAYVVNEFDTAYGAMRSFTTLPIFDTIALLPNGGIGTPDTMRVERGVETTLHANTFTHGGNWQFLAWNTDVSGSGTQYADQATITTKGNLTLYAQWRTWCEGTPQANELGTSRIDSVKDHQNNWYNVVQIGNQCWMKENMRCTTEPDGGSIVLNADSNSNNTPMAYSSNVAKYGYLYNFAAAMNIDDDATDFSYPHRGICPKGWHIPTSEEWTTLATEAGVGINGGTGAGKLVGGNNWNAANYSTASYPGSYGYAKRDSTGFSALPAGYGDENGVKEVGYEAGFWSSTPNENTSAYRWCLYIYEFIDQKTDGRSYGHSVRCVRDEETHTAMSVTTDSANHVVTIEARLHGNVTNMGGRTSVKVGFKYGTSESALTSIVADESEIIGTGRFYNNITGLTANTTYYFKAFVANSTDTVYGEVKNFTTLMDVVTDTIAFVPNGGQGTMDTMLVNRGDTVLNANTYTHDGNWQFIGWNTEANGSGTQYADQDAITTNGNLTLYAQWSTWCTGTPRANELGTSRIDSVKDINNNQYTVVQIGNQCWMKENLRTSTNTAGTGNIYTPTTTGYDVETYGRLYDWAAVMQGASSTNYPVSGNKVHGICPDGWHVPSDNEWDTLTTHVNSVDDYKCGGTANAIAKALAATTGWRSDNATCAVGNTPEYNNKTGFSAVPAGYYYNSSIFDFGEYPNFWSATKYNDNNAWDYYLSYNNDSVARTGGDKSCGLSVRCVRNEETGGDEPTAEDTVFCYPNLGANIPDTYTVTRGESFDLSTVTFTHPVETNWEIASWNTEADSSGTRYEINATIANTEGNITLYAQWHTWCTGTPNTSVNEFGSSRIDSLQDIENNKYTVVQIGNQCWMKQNLRTSSGSTNGETGIYTPTTEEVPGYNEKIYGKYYDWAAVMQVENANTTSYTAGDKHRGICPSGWHVPSNAEWDALTTYVNSKTEYRCGGTDNAIANALSGGTWSTYNECYAGYRSETFNKTGFSAVRTGSYFAEAFLGYNGYAYFWSATESEDDKAWYHYLGSNGPRVNSSTDDKSTGYSVRCLRNANPMSATTDSATTVTNNSANLYGNVTSMGDNAEVTAGFRYGQHPDYMTFKTESTVAATSAYNAELTNLSPNTTYYFQAYAATATDTAWTADTLTFTTLTNPCSVLSLRAGTELSGGRFANKEYGSDRKMDSVSDHEGNVYRVVEIGRQCWMAQNMRAATEPDGGTMVLNADPVSVTTPMAYSSNVAKYGYLYNFAAAMNIASDTTAFSDPHRGICPEGWHIPTNDEWTTMANAAGVGINDGTGAGKLTAGNDWYGDAAATYPGNYAYADRNRTGFSALPAGASNMTGDVESVDRYAYFWSATPTVSDGAYSWYLYYSYENIRKYSDKRYYGLSVRCVRDEETAPCAPTSSTHDIEISTSELPYTFGTDTTFLAGTTTGTYILHRTNAAGCDSTITINLTVNAIPTDITDTIAFVPNGGIGAPDTTMVERGEEVTVPTNTYTHDGNWQFAGWNTEANGSGTPYAANATFTANGNITLFAQWNTWCDGTPLNNELGTARIDSVKDHEDNWYKVVQIGSQCWLKENMRATTEPGSATHIALNSGASLTEPRIYSTDSGFVAQYGYLYNFPAAMNTGGESSRISYPHRGICPEGWHVPTNDDWALLAATAGVPDYLYVPGTTEFTNGLGKLTGGTDWMTASWGTAPGCYNYIYRDSTGFSARPAGCYYEGSIRNVGESAYFWTSSEDDYYLHIYYSYGAISYGSGEAHSTGYSVRCVRNTLSVATDSATAVTTSSAILNGTILSLGDYGTAKAGFKYGTSSNALNAKVEKSENVEVGAYNCTISGLTANTTYFYKAFVVGGNSTDTLWTADTLHFTTLSENPCSGTPTVTDADGNVYNTVKIGRQCWMAQNLRTETKRNGQGNIYNLRESSMLGAEGYDVATYGLMYDWAAVMQSAESSTTAPSGVQGICPDGWHVPSSAEWDTLTQYVFSNDAYKCGCSSTQWERNTPCIANALAAGAWDSPESCCAGDATADNFNKTGFSALPAGYHIGSYFGFGFEAGFWSATADNTPQEYPENEQALCWFLRKFESKVAVENRTKQDAYSVRCVRNIPTISFHPNGGQGRLDTIFVTDGNTVLAANTCIHGGNWRFEGWNTEPDGSGTHYDDQAAIVVEDDLTLYAQWHTWCSSTSQNNQATTRIDSVKDHENNWYKVVQIGNQCWLKENMRATTEPGGGNIVLNADSASNTTPMAYSVDVAKYGYLYNFPAIMNITDGQLEFNYPHRGICPDGWHIPTDEEWITMFNTASVSSRRNGTGVGKLAGGNDWGKAKDATYPGNYNYAERDSTGFSALPAGLYYNETYYNVNQFACFWTSSPWNERVVINWNISESKEYLIKSRDLRSSGFSVRCVRSGMSVVTDTIAFCPNGGQGTMDTMSVIRGTTVLSANAYTHGGNWQFDGWNTEPDGSGIHYTDQDTITTSGNLTLFAQ